MLIVSVKLLGAKRWPWWSEAEPEGGRAASPFPGRRRYPSEPCGSDGVVMLSPGSSGSAIRARPGAEDSPSVVPSRIEPLKLSAAADSTHGLPGVMCESARAPTYPAMRARFGIGDKFRPLSDHRYVVPAGPRGDEAQFSQPAASTSLTSQASGAHGQGARRSCWLHR